MSRTSSSCVEHDRPDIKLSWYGDNRLLVSRCSIRDCPQWLFSRCWRFLSNWWHVSVPGLYEITFKYFPTFIYGITWQNVIPVQAAQVCFHAFSLRGHIYMLSLDYNQQQLHKISRTLLLHVDFCLVDEYIWLHWLCLLVCEDEIQNIGCLTWSWVSRFQAMLKEECIFDSLYKNACWMVVRSYARLCVPVYLRMIKISHDNDVTRLAGWSFDKHFTEENVFYGWNTWWAIQASNQQIILAVQLHRTTNRIWEVFRPCCDLYSFQWSMYI